MHKNSNQILDFFPILAKFEFSLEFKYELHRELKLNFFFLSKK
jgi:hypothetical protein